MATRHYYKFILLVFAINCITIYIQSYPIWPASVSSKSALKTIEDTTCVPQSSEWSQETETFAVVCSPASNSMYYLYRVQLKSKWYIIFIIMTQLLNILNFYIAKIFL